MIGQPAFEDVSQAVCRNGRRRVTVGDLPFGVHPGVGPAGPGDVGWVSEAYGEGSLESALDSGPAARFGRTLDRPARVAGAAVPQRELQSTL